jgi:DNA repair protein RadD
MRAELKREIQRFDRETVQFCRCLTSSQLNYWLSRIDQGGDDLGSQLLPEFPIHGGAKALLDYQSEVLSMASAHYSEVGRRALISLPTGAGKTFTALRLAFISLAIGYRKILWMAPQKILLDQALSELRASWYSVPQSVALDVFGRKDFSSSNSNRAIIRFETIQKLLREQRTSEDAGVPDLVVVDEAHHLQGNEFGRLAERLGGLGASVVGLTATPGRAASVEIEALTRLFSGKLIYPRSLGEDPIGSLKERGVYAKITYRKLLPKSESSEEKTLRRRSTVRQRSYAFMPGRLDAVIDAVRDFSPGRRSLVFTSTVAHALVVWAALSANGVPSEVVGSEFGAWHNQAAVGKFRSGESCCLVNVKYAAVGADFPFADAVVLTVPISSAVMFEQIVGRISRGPAVGGTLEALLCDFDGHLRKFGGLQSYARFLSEWEDG